MCSVLVINRVSTCSPLHYNGTLMSEGFASKSLRTGIISIFFSSHLHLEEPEGPWRNLAGWNVFIDLGRRNTPNGFFCSFYYLLPWQTHWTKQTNPVREYSFPLSNIKQRTIGQKACVRACMSLGCSSFRTSRPKPDRRAIFYTGDTSAIIYVADSGVRWCFKMKRQRFYIKCKFMSLLYFSG